MRKIKSYIIIFLIILLMFSTSCDNNCISNESLDMEKINNLQGIITVTYCNINENEESLSNFVLEFNKRYPNVKIIFDKIKANDLSAKVFSGNIGDVFWLAEESTYMWAKERKVLLPLDSYLEVFNIDTQNIFSTVYDLGVVDGLLYMVPREYDHIVFFTNVDALKEANLDMPKNGWTWEDFKEYASFLTKENEDGTYSQVACNIMLNYDPIYIPFLEGWGGTWVDIVNEKINLTGEKEIKGITEMITAAEDGYLYPTGVIGKKAEKYQLLKESDYVFQQLVHPQLYNKANKYDEMNIDWDIVNFPHFPTPKVGAGTSGYGVYKKSKNKEAAAAFVLFFLTEEGQKAYHKESSNSIPIISTLMEDSFNGNRKWENKNLDAFIMFPEYDTIGQVQCRVPAKIADLIDGTSWNNMLTQHFSGTKNFKDSLKEIEDLANLKWKDIR